MLKMDQEGAKLLRAVKDWLTQNVLEPTKTTVGRICNAQNNKLVLKAVLLLERFGKKIQYLDPISALLEAIESLKEKIARAI